MQTARAALSVAARVCPRTALSTYTRPTAGMVLVHTSPPHPSGSKQNCLRPDMPYKTDYTDWRGLGMGLFIGAGVLVTAALYEFNKSLQTTHTPSKVPPVPAQGVHYVPSDISQHTGLSQIPQAPQAPAGVLFRNVGHNDTSDRKVAGSETRSDQKDQRVFTQFDKSAVRNDKTTSVEKSCKCPRDVSDETPTAVGQGPVKEVMTLNSDVRDQKSPSACPFGRGQVSEGKAETDRDFCEEDVTHDVTPDVTNSCALPDPADVIDTEDDVRSSSRETSPRPADFTEAEVITVTACPVQHDLSSATRKVTGSAPHVTDKTDSEISMEEFLIEGVFEYESGCLYQHVTVSPLLQKKLRCAVLYADWREDSQFCYPDDVTTNQKVRFSWFGQEDDQHDLDDVTANQKVRFSWFGQEDDDHDLDDVCEVKIYCAVLEGVWREEGGLVENHVTSTTGSDDDVMEPYYPGHGRRNGFNSGNENWV